MFVQNSINSKTEKFFLLSLNKLKIFSSPTRRQYQLNYATTTGPGELRASIDTLYDVKASHCKKDRLHQPASCQPERPFHETIPNIKSRKKLLTNLVRSSTVVNFKNVYQSCIPNVKLLSSDDIILPYKFCIEISEDTVDLTASGPPYSKAP